jgi:trk system potassium uptake protein TrkA
MYIIIAGGGEIGYNLAKALIADKHEVLVIEKDINRYNLFSKELGEAIFYGNCCEIATLKSIGTGRADWLIAVTGLDQENLIICQLAKLLFMVPKTLAVVNDPKNEKLFESLGVDIVVNTTSLISVQIGHQLNMGALIPLLTVQNLIIVQAEIDDSSPAVHQKVKDLKLPPDTILIAAIRQEEAVLLKGDTIILPNDRILAITLREKEEDLKKVL